MGRSIRSKAGIKNRNNLRETVFGPREAERIQRLAAKQQITSGTTEDLMAVDAKKEEEEEAEDVTMGTTGTYKRRHKKYGSKKGPLHGKRQVVRNKHGRILSKNCVRWTKQRRAKR